MLTRSLVPVLTLVMGAGLTLGACGSSSNSSATGGAGGSSAGSGGSSTGGSGGSATGGSGGSSTGGAGGATGGATGATGGSGGTGAGGITGRTIFKCAGPGSNSCTQAETDSYNGCLLDKCSDAYAACIGANFKNTGELGGLCGPYFKCVNACACNDIQCLFACGPSGPPAECTSCLNTASTCQKTNCPQPACFGTKADDAGTSNPGADGGAGGAACDDLKKCCDSLPAGNALKATCTMTAASMQSTTCSSILAGLKQAMICQ